MALTYARDAKDRVTAVTSSNAGDSWAYQYDGQGQLTLASNTSDSTKTQARGFYGEAGRWFGLNSAEDDGRDCAGNDDGGHENESQALELFAHIVRVLWGRFPAMSE